MFDGVAVGNSAPFNVTLTSDDGLADQFTFSCPNLPAGVNCTFRPASGTLQANQALTSVLTISVTSKPASRRAGEKLHNASWILATSPGFFAIVFIGTVGMPRRRSRFLRWAQRLGISAGLLFVLGLPSCGGGGSSSSTSPPPPPPPPVTVNIQVQATSPSITKTFSSISVSVP
jgi:hypothetical protein